MRPTTPKTRAEFVFGTCRIIAKHILSSESPSLSTQNIPTTSIEQNANALGVDNVTVIPWEFDVANAFVLGTPRTCYVVISSALIDILTEDELVAVITHEMAHAAQHHTFRLTGELLFYLFISFLSYKATDESLRGGIVTGAVLLVSAVLLLRDVRRAEEEADSNAMAVMDNPDSLPSGVAKVNSAGRDGQPERSHVDDIIATHPSLDDRF